MKKAVNPLYGKKGMGWVKDPKKAMYNKVYNKTSFGVGDMVRVAGGAKAGKPKKKTRKNVSSTPIIKEQHAYTAGDYKMAGIVMIILGLLLLAIPFLGIPLLFLGIISFGVASLFSRK